MSLGRNVSRARSHIIFLIALLSASAYILWIESERGVLKEELPSATFANASAAPAPAHPSRRQSIPPDGWRVELGNFRSAEAAGRQWDALRSQPAVAQSVEIALTARGELIRLEVRGIPSEAAARRLCEIARRKKVDCLLVPPLKRDASAT